MVRTFFYFFLGFSGLAFGATTPFEGKVVAVQDGDTLSVLGPARQVVKVRLAGVDAPEHHQAFGSVCRQFLADNVFAKVVYIQPIGSSEVDQYGRLIATVFHEKTDINLLLIQSGCAWHYIKYARAYQKIEEFLVYAEAEKRARALKIGLWVDPVPINPAEFRRNK